MKKIKTLSIALALAFTLLSCKEKTAQPARKEFLPALDRATKTTIEIAGYLANFEALDQAIIRFNEFYPDVQFIYSSNSNYNLAKYIETNPGLGIFMVEHKNLKYENNEVFYAKDYCLDLKDFDTSCIIPEALADSYVDGRLLSIPVAMNPVDIVVNKTLLQKEGLSVPLNHKEFFDSLETLKQKGYIPVQGSQRHIYAELVYNKGMSLLSDAAKLKDLLSGKDKDGSIVLSAFEDLETVINKGYTDYELNCTFPGTNYDGSILAFLEGRMPYFVCTTEVTSGIKKRETKSKVFPSAPFEYDFYYAPMGTKGAYVLNRPWNSFSVNKNSEHKELAIEFLRFLATSGELDKMAVTKGMPSVLKNGTYTRFSGIVNPKNVEKVVASAAPIPTSVKEAFFITCNDFGAGKYKTAKEAAAAFVQQCVQ